MLMLQIAICRRTRTSSDCMLWFCVFCHQSVPVNIDAVVNRFAKAPPRRMLLLNAVQDESVALFDTSNLLS